MRAVGGLDGSRVRCGFQLLELLQNLSLPVEKVVGLVQDRAVRGHEHQERPDPLVVGPLKRQVGVHQVNRAEPIVLLEVEGRSLVVARDHADDLDARLLVLSG